MAVLVTCAFTRCLKAVQTAICEFLAIVRETDSRCTGDTLPTARLTLASCYNFALFKWPSLNSNNLTCVNGSLRCMGTSTFPLDVYNASTMSTTLTCIYVTWKRKVLVVPCTNCSSAFFRLRAQQKKQCKINYFLG